MPPLEDLSLAGDTAISASTFGVQLARINEIITLLNAQLTSDILAGLTTTATDTLVNAINELDADQILQTIYENSTSPEITTNGTNGAVTIKGGTGTDTDNNLEVSNNAGAMTLYIQADGTIGVLEGVAAGTPATNTVAIYAKTDGLLYSKDSAGVEKLMSTGFTPSTTDTLTNKTIDANGTGNSISNIDVEDLSDGTAGEMIAYGTSGTPGVTAVGTSGHAMTSNGAGNAPTMQDVGKIVQIVGQDGVVTTAVTAQTATKVEFPDIAFSITPSNTSNKVLVNINSSFALYTGGSSACTMGIEIRRGVTVVFSDPKAVGNHNVSTGTQYVYHNYSVEFLDSPATTSSVEYTLWGWESSGVGGLRHIAGENGYSTILKEIKVI